MKTILESDYYLIEKDIEKSLFRYTAKAATEDLTDELFFEESQQLLGEFIKSNCKFAIANDKDFKYPITPVMQTEFNKIILKNLNNTILEKFAHIIPEELIAELSVEQAFDENTEKTYTEKYFATMEKAEKWLFA